MGISFSCPLSDSEEELENGVESVIVKSISFGDTEFKTLVRSFSFNRQDSDPTIMKSLSSGKMIVEGSISYKRRELETMISINVPSLLDEEKTTSTTPICSKSSELDYVLPKSDSFLERFPESPVLNSGDPKYQAALKLQKVYKSFRTRRKLADCAVLVELEQSWWNLLDSAELKHSSISFFDIEKHETAISRWARARTRAAKVGKGLSKNDKARKLALQHWLEAIDPRHRYGHNLHFYYLKWLRCQSREPFFYWLDIGEGKEVNLVEKCPRSKLQQQCIKYLGPMERKAYEVAIVDGKLLYKQTGAVLDTRGVPKDAKWIFVLSTSKDLYVGLKKKGTFQHSSFLAGGAASAAGRLVVENGILKVVWPHSGHYQPTKENFEEFISFLEENNVNLADVKMTPVDDEDASVIKRKSTFCLRSNSSEEDLTRSMKGSEMGEIGMEECYSLKSNSLARDPIVAFELPKSWQSTSLGRLTDLEIPDGSKLFERLESESLNVEQTGYHLLTAEAFPSEDHMESRKDFDEYDDGDDIEFIPEESILHKQLGRKLSRTWTTGAGPRISCVRDYPSELQSRALEQVHLSPRSNGCFRSDFSPRSTGGQRPEVLTPTSFCRGQELLPSPRFFDKASPSRTSMWDCRTQPSPLRRGTSVAANFSQS